MAARGPRRSATATTPASSPSSRLPDGTPRGVVVVIHGGFWKAAYDLSLGRPLAADLVEKGWAALNIEYRRVGHRRRRAEHPRRRARGDRHARRPRPRPDQGRHAGPLGRRPPGRLGRARGRRGHPRDLAGRRPRPGRGRPGRPRRRRGPGVPRPPGRPGRRGGRPAPAAAPRRTGVVRARAPTTTPSRSASRGTTSRPRPRPARRRSWSRWPATTSSSSTRARRVAADPRDPRRDRLQAPRLDDVGHVVVGDRRLAEQVLRVLRVEDRGLDVLAGERRRSPRATPRATA